MTSGITGFDLLVTNAYGVVESCSNGAFESLGKYVGDDMLQLVNPRETTIFMSSLNQIYPENRQVMGMPLLISIDGEIRTFGYLFVTSDAVAFRQEWRNFISAFVLLSLSVMALAFVIAYIATRKQADPINEMARAARRFARGEFEVRVKDYGRKDEIGQLTEAFNAMAESLESSERLRRDFIANLSHELKTPMTIIAGFAEGLLDGTIPRKDEARYLDVVFSETRRLSRLVRSMLDISTLRSAESKSYLEKSFDVSELVRLTLLSLSVKIEEKRLDVEARLPEDVIMTRGDEDSMTQVVYNLIDNAIKFSDPDSTIGLEVWQCAYRVYVSVSNKGETIPHEELPKIFDRFHKADRSRSEDRDGVGLGLYIVKQILDKHEEDIFVTSSNTMTRFIFSLTSV